MCMKSKLVTNSSLKIAAGIRGRDAKKNVYEQYLRFGKEHRSCDFSEQTRDAIMYEH